MTGYDFIGDIHAQADRLRELLAKMGYAAPDFIHRDGRKVIFLGDFINRGTQNKEVIEIVQKIMKNGGRAVMGNHEMKAICYSKTGIHGHIRPHTFNNTAEHTDFLAEYPYGTDAYKRVVSWFETLPVYIRTPHFNVVHACWSERAIRASAKHVRSKDGTLKETAYGAYDTENSTIFSDALDTLLKGPKYKLPRGVNYPSSQGGDPSKEARLLWWRDKSSRAEDLIEKGALVDAFLSVVNKKQIHVLRNKFNYSFKVPVFIGHYNVPSEPDIVSPKVACLNFKGFVTGYRWNMGDKVLSPDRLVFV